MKPLPGLKLGRCQPDGHTTEEGRNRLSYQEFIFPMRDALIDRIVERLEALAWTPLTRTAVDGAIPEGADRALRGVYLLGHSVDSVVQLRYVGQSEQAVYDRLRRHANFVQDRCGLPPESVYFKGLGVLIFDSVALESGLIERYGARVRWNKTDPLSGWNLGGLGSNDTGGGRDRQKPSGFDRRYPIDITIPKLGLLDPGAIPARRLFQQVSERLPYTVRLPRNLRSHPDLVNTTINVEPGINEISLRQTLQVLLRGLPPSWSVQVFPGRVVLANNERDPRGALVNIVEWPPETWSDLSIEECPVVVFRSQTIG